MSTTLAAISPLFDALGRVPFIAGVLTRGTLLVLIAACLTRLLGRSPAAARHLVWSLSVGGLLLLPAMTLIPWRLELTTLAAARDAFAPAPAADASVPERLVLVVKNDQSKQIVADAGSTAMPTPPTLNIGAESADEASTPPSPIRPLEAGTGPVLSSLSRLPDPAMMLTLAWLTGMAWMLGRLLVGVANVRRIVQSSVPADGADWQRLVDDARASIGAEPRARIVISEEAAMPFTYGLFRPVIVLPATADEWSTERRRSVLLHELAHVRRRDLVTNAIVQLACAVYWFHPLVRLAARRVRIEAERACDALVVAAGTRPSDYAGDLLEIARTMRSSTTAAVALAMARRSDFEGRLLAILSPDAGRNMLTATRAALVALSFAAPAVAIAAAVPAGRVTPNEAVTENNRAVTDHRSAAGQAEAEPAESRASVAVPAAEEPQTPQAPQASQQRDTAVPALLSVLRDENAAVRLAAVESLGNLSDPRAVDALVQALRTDTDPRVREAAAEALGEIDSPRAVPGLIAALGSEKVPAVRAKIAWALGEIDDARAVEALGGAVRDPDAEVRRQVVWALGELESPAAVPMLIPALKDADVETRKQAAEALGEIGSKDAVEALLPVTKDTDAEVRKEAVSALGNIQDKRALPALEAAVSDANVEVRRQAIEAIGQLDDLKTAPPALISALKDEDHEVRKSAAEALGNLEDESAVPALIPLTRDADVEVKRAAVGALSSIGGVRAVEVMAGLLKDDDPEIRKLAAEALGKRR
jgi:HEAT repeat protein/beta-lactamase regulating signal transducer with metallopeptidase domain